MRKLPAALAVLALTAAALVGCSAQGTVASCPRETDADSATMRLISVSGASDAVPTVHMNTPLHTRTTQFRDVKAGTGEVPIASNRQMVGLDVTLLSAQTGKPVAATAYTHDVTRLMPLSQWVQSFPAFSTALHCATAGTRVVIAMAPGGASAATAASFGVAPSQSMVAVVDVRQVFLAAANGAPVYNSGFDMPSVVRAPDGRPGIILRGGQPPRTLTTELLKRGDGPKVTEADPVVLNYTIVGWQSQTVTTTTWGSSPKIVSLSAQPKGFREAVVGQRVGSQVMAIIPRADAGSGATDTEVAVIDILGVTNKATAAASTQQQ